MKARNQKTREEILEIKTRLTEIMKKNNFDEFIRPDTVKESICELGNISKEISKTEKQNF